MMTITGIWNNMPEMTAFLATLPPDVVRMYNEGFDHAEQYRASYLEWMNYVPPPVFYVDDDGVRPYR